MKTVRSRSSARATAVVLAALAVVLSVGAATAAQNGTAAASGTATAAASAPASAKTTRSANRALRKRVYAAFATDRSIDAGTIGVSAKNGVVTLSGTVDNPAQIDKAVALASGVEGVQSVKNRLSVKREFGQ